MKQQSSISSWLADHELELIQAADYIFQHPELAYKEELSSKYLSNYLEQQGFHISKETAGVSTAFTAEWGHGKPVLGFLAEYDALAELGHASRHRCCGRRMRSKSRHGSNWRIRHHPRLWMSGRRDYVRQDRNDEARRISRSGCGSHMASL